MRIVVPWPTEWGLASSWGWATIIVTMLAARAAAQPTTIPDPPARRAPPAVGASGFRSSANLDGLYVWLGPVGAASRADGAWDSTFGGDLSIVRVDEGAHFGVLGATAGASLWSAREGGRIWVDAVIGTRIGGRMYGASLGPILELGELEHPRFGGSVGAWAFFGVAPFARVGAVEELGAFVEIGLHLALPVWSSR